jgi:tRNA threonylcarbamoyladenosine biosynthesis protein TsaE
VIGAAEVATSHQQAVKRAPIYRRPLSYMKKIGQYLLPSLVGYNGGMSQAAQKPNISKSLSDTEKLAVSFVTNLKPAKSGATIFGLAGDLGSGKTTFTKEVATLFGIKKEGVTSPTFVIMKIYKPRATRFTLHASRFTHLIHIDAYRLEKSDELLHLGWKEISKDKNNLIFIEWPERVKEILPKTTKTIYFEFIDENTRSIVLP